MVLRKKKIIVLLFLLLCDVVVFLNMVMLLFVGCEKLVFVLCVVMDVNK